MIKKILMSFFCLFFCTSFLLAGEHGGKAVGHKEHGGKSVGHKEHGGKSVTSSKKQITAKMIKAAINKHIKSKSKKGHMLFKDSVTSKSFKFKFIKIHDPVRHMPEKKQYFACTDFHVVGSSKEVYDLDFWLDENLNIVDEKIHKDSVIKYEKKPRYTFKGEKIVNIP
jgi:hypothetical protein